MQPRSPRLLPLILVLNLVSSIQAKWMYPPVVVLEGKPAHIPITSFMLEDQEVAKYGLNGADEDKFELVNQKRNSQGRLKVQIRVKKPLDREQMARYSFTLEAFDKSGGKVDSTVVEIVVDDVNDNFPEIINPPNKNEVVLENKTKYDIFKISVEDKDDPNGLYGKNSIQYLPPTDLTVFFVNGSSKRVPDQEIENFFTVTQTGTVRTTSFSRIDAEVHDRFTMKFVVKDSKGCANGSCPQKESAVYDATIVVKDANDNRPIFEQTEFTFTVGELTAKDTEIGSVMVRDDDVTPEHKEVEFSFDKFDDIFKISTDSGDRTVGNIALAADGKLDFETKKTYQFKVTARNKKSLRLGDEGFIFCVVLSCAILFFYITWKIELCRCSSLRRRSHHFL